MDIGKYMGEEIGVGCSGSVHRLHGFINKQWVVKIIKILNDNSKILKYLTPSMRSKLTNFESQFSNFTNSITIQIMASQAGISPKIISYSNIQTVSEDMFLIMEYIEGLTLAAHNQQYGCSSELQSALTNAVDKMHKLGIVHNDLCSDNIIITPDMKIYIIDFDSSRISSDPDDFKNDYIIC